jgi:quinohemoprotein ethanol dehydrogenase
LSGYDAMTGERVWHFNAGLGILAAPISYSVASKQYISVLVGYGGSAAIGSNLMHVGWKYGAQPRWLLTFALDGKAVLAPSEPPDMAIKPVDDPSVQIAEADVAAGHDLFMACAICHGRELVSAGAPGPDLRESRAALNSDSFWTVVHDGALIEHGMPRFETLTREQVRQLYAYIRAGARKALATRKGDGSARN